jgi:ABC-2 type transport system ATP-binding protein
MPAALRLPMTAPTEHLQVAQRAVADEHHVSAPAAVAPIGAAARHVCLTAERDGPIAAATRLHVYASPVLEHGINYGGLGSVVVSASDSVQLQGLAKSFRSARGPVHAVRGIDVSINRGETVALLGPNGAGKSTTIDMLLGLLPPDTGNASIFGRNPREAVAAGAIGAMLQTGAVIRDVTVRELIAMMAALYPHALDVDEVIDLVGLREIADRRSEKLSGGETQRVRFAIALVCDPELLVLDEPTVAMDVESRRAFWTTMREFASRGKTVLFATHYLDEADDYADRAVLMAAGRVVADGPTTEIKARVGSRIIRATLPGVSEAELATLPGVTTAEHRGEAVLLRCSDSDTAIRALLAAHPQARDIEITGAGLEEAFIELTAEAAA